MTSDQSSSTTDAWLTTGRFALLLALLVFATFPGVVLGTRTFIFRDYGLFSYPVAFFQRECFWRGEMPLWNPYNLCGVPFLAQWNTMCLYPPTLLYLLLPLTWGLSFFCLLHLVWGGLGMYLLARNWTGNCAAAGTAGIIFAFSGLSLNFLMWPSHVATFSWLPWVLYLAPQAWQEGGRKLLWAVTAGAMQMLAGGPETILFTWIVLVLLACGDLIRQRAPREGKSPGHYPDELQGPWVPSHSLSGGASRRQLALRFAGMVFLIALICAVQLLPFFELLRQSQRQETYSATSYDWRMPIWGWANFLVPLFHCHRSSQGVFLQPVQNWTSSYYAGIGTVWLATIAIRRRRDWRVVLIAVVVLWGMMLALGDEGFVYRGLRFLIPALGFVRYPVKFVIVVLGLAPLLAAFGLAALSQSYRAASADEGASSNGVGPEPTRGSPILSCIKATSRAAFSSVVEVLVVLVLIVALLIYDWKHPAPGEAWNLTCRNGLGRAGLLVLVYCCAACLVKAQGRRRALWSVLLLALFWLDFLTHVPSQNPTAQPPVYSPGWAKAQLDWHSPPKLGLNRVMLAPAVAKVFTFNTLPDVEEDYRVKRLAYFCDCNLLDDVAQIHGFFCLSPGPISSLASLPYAHPEGDFWTLLDFMAVAEITAPGKVFGWDARPGAMPVVTAGQQPLFGGDQAVINSILETNADFRKTVFLPTEAHKVVTAIGQPEARVECREFNNQKVRVETHSPTPCLVVISQTWYPEWRAFVDGRPIKLWRANYAFQAVEVGAGQHEVDLVYEDGTFRTGAAISILGLLVWAGLLIRRSCLRHAEAS